MILNEVYKIIKIEFQIYPFQVNCIQQLENIAAYPFLYDRLSKNDLFLHALWYDIHTGKVFLLSRKQKQFIEINEDSFFTLMTEIKIEDKSGKY